MDRRSFLKRLPALAAAPILMALPQDTQDATLTVGPGTVSAPLRVSGSLAITGCTFTQRPDVPAIVVENP